MKMKNGLRRLDLNLLLILDALSEERSVTAVARRLRISQPTVSFSLNKLRDFFQDELFVRQGMRMQATPFAETIHEPVRRIIETINQEILRDHDFDPLTSERTFCISTSDIGEMVFCRTYWKRYAVPLPGPAFAVSPCRLSSCKQRWPTA